MISPVPHHSFLNPTHSIIILSHASPSTRSSTFILFPIHFIRFRSSPFHIHLIYLFFFFIDSFIIFSGDPLFFLFLSFLSFCLPSILFCPYLSTLVPYFSIFFIFFFSFYHLSYFVLIYPLPFHILLCIFFYPFGRQSLLLSLFINFFSHILLFPYSSYFPPFLFILYFPVFALFLLSNILFFFFNYTTI